MFEQPVECPQCKRVWILQQGTPDIVCNCHLFCTQGTKPSDCNVKKVAFGSVPDPVLYLPFEEGAGTTTYDQSGNDNDGTINGASWGGGRYGKALSFNGTSDHVDTGIGTQIGKEISILAWVNVVDVIALERPIVGKGNLGENTLSYSFVVDVTTPKLLFGISPDGSSIYYILTNNAIPLGEWVHVACVYTGSTLKAYKNGAEMAGAITGSSPASLYWSSEKQFVGYDDTFGTYFKGIMDEVRIYNKALSVEEIGRVIGEDKKWLRLQYGWPAGLHINAKNKGDDVAHITYYCSTHDEYYYKVPVLIEADWERWFSRRAPKRLRMGHREY